MNLRIAPMVIFVSWYSKTCIDLVLSQGLNLFISVNLVSVVHAYKYSSTTTTTHITHEFAIRNDICYYINFSLIKIFFDFCIVEAANLCHN